MKVFIVNVNNCLNMSLYGPFFYENIRNGSVAFLDNITDTSELDKVYETICAQINRKSFSYQKSAVILFIPRDMTMPLSPRQYELYNDINVYMKLLRNARNDFRFYTFYVDKTGQMYANEKIYEGIRNVSYRLTSPDERFNGYFPCDFEYEPSECVDYKCFIREKTKGLRDDTRCFYELMLEGCSDCAVSGTDFVNMIRNYVGTAKEELKKVGHIYEYIYKADISEEIRKMIRIIYYIKHLAGLDCCGVFSEKEKIPSYEEFVFTENDYNRVKLLMATYIARLRNWYNSSVPPSAECECDIRSIYHVSDIDEKFRPDMDAILEEALGIDVAKIDSLNVVDMVFKNLTRLVNRARHLLEQFGADEVKQITDKDRVVISKQTVRLDEEENDSFDEEEKLRMMNNYSSASLPEYAEENRLEQELEIKNKRIQLIFSRMKIYSFVSFAAALGFSLASVAVFYMGAQYSVFLNEKSWWVYGIYLLIAAVLFALGFIFVRRKYVKQIKKLLEESKQSVRTYLSAFYLFAAEFEKNINAAADYYCFRSFRDEKAKERRRYKELKEKYSWHKEKVANILMNFEFFKNFLAGVTPVEESVCDIEDYLHDDEHSEFYQMIIFN